MAFDRMRTRDCYLVTSDSCSQESGLLSCNMHAMCLLSGSVSMFVAG